MSVVQRLLAKKHVLRVVVLCICFCGLLSHTPSLKNAGEDTSVLSLFKPFAQGVEVVDGYVMGVPRRGEEHDIVIAVTNAKTRSRVEVHLLDKGRWRGIRESAHYGIAYETPRSSAPVEDCEKVTQVLADVVAQHDQKNAPVDTLKLAGESEPPWFSTLLLSYSQSELLKVATCLMGITWALAGLPGAAYWSMTWLFLLGLALRAYCSWYPFEHDQDVQRLFTGHMSLKDIFTGIGLTDRHPPLYFAVLHFAQWFGQAEGAVRAPAVVCGALLGPLIVGVSARLKGDIELAAILALAFVVSPELIVRSREVSSIPFYGCLLALCVLCLGILQREKHRNNWSASVLGALAMGLCFWTYYLAVFAWSGVALVLGYWRRSFRTVAGMVAGGALLGTPAIALGIVTFFRDRGARSAASVQPNLAWGDRTSTETLVWMGGTTLDAVGAAMLLLLIGSVFYAGYAKNKVPFVVLALIVATVGGVAVLAPVARVQPYYVTTVIPLILHFASPAKRGDLAEAKRAIFVWKNKMLGVSYVWFAMTQPRLTPSTPKVSHSDAERKSISTHSALPVLFSLPSRYQTSPPKLPTSNKNRRDLLGGARGDGLTRHELVQRPTPASFRLGDSDPTLTSFGGLAAFDTFLNQEGIDEALTPLDRFKSGIFVVYPMSVQFRTLIDAFAVGAHRLFDLEALAADPFFVTMAGGVVASLDTYYRDIARPDEQARAALHGQMVAQGLKVLSGKTLDCCFLDVDTFVVRVEGESIEGAEIGYNPTLHGHRSYHPVVVRLAEYDTTVGFTLRPGNTTFGKEEIPCIVEAIHRVREQVGQCTWLYVRIDKAGDCADVMKAIEQTKSYYLIKAKMDEVMAQVVLRAPAHRWKTVDEDADGNPIRQIAEVDFQRDEWKKKSLHPRVIAIRMLDGKGNKLDFLDGQDWTVQVYLTNDTAHEADELGHCYDTRAGIEPVIGQLRGAWGVDAVNSQKMGANEVVMLLKLLTYNLLRRYVLAKLPQHVAKWSTDWLRHLMLCIPGRLVRGPGRTWILRLAYRPWLVPLD